MLGSMTSGFANPKGIGTSSPGLRASRYPGWEHREITTLKGLNLAAKQLMFNPFMGLAPTTKSGATCQGTSEVAPSLLLVPVRAVHSVCVVHSHFKAIDKGENL